MASITPEVELQIRQHVPWKKLSSSIKESLGNNQATYDRLVVEYSKTNQFIWKTSLVRNIYKNERKYYEEMVFCSRNNLMLYPYHLQDQFVQGLKVTPFDYYRNMLEMIMVDQKSYDSLPNFTARDCLRLTGIGRNEYIDMMNRYRSKRFWKRRLAGEFIPTQPLKDIPILPWWLVNVGYVTEEEVEHCTPEEHKTIDFIIKQGPQVAGSIDQEIVRNLFLRKILYLVINIDQEDYIVVPPLKGFVMNRVQGDYFENLLYKIFVSINEHTTIGELANVLQLPLKEVQCAVSVFIRLGFAHKKSVPDPSTYHESWRSANKSNTDGQPSIELSDSGGLVMEDFLVMEGDTDEKPSTSNTNTTTPAVEPLISGSGYHKRIGFLFDSTLTAFLMMGNLSPSLKNHAVTMFEVGKLADEAMDSFMTELDKVGEEPEGEGEAQRYFHHAMTLRNTIQFLRNNPQLTVSDEEGTLGLDLLHCESISKLDQGTLSRLMQKNYSILVSMAPLSQEVHSVSTCTPPHIGPAIPEMNSIWFKLWLYHKLKCGPPSLLLTRGTRLTTLPMTFRRYKKLLLTSWGHDHAVISTSNSLLSLNEALTHSSVLIQAYSWHSEGKLEYVTFPFERCGTAEDDLVNHPVLKQLEQITDLKHTCGYVTMLCTGAPITNKKGSGFKNITGRPIDERFQAKKEEISEFLEDLKELGIGEQTVEPTPEDLQQPVSEGGAEQQETLSPPIKKMSVQWMPLELCFGIPLFNDEANHSISEKIITHRLFALSSLQNLTQAYRLLTMDLMDFINQYQEGDVYSHKSHQLQDDDPTVPLPTKSLLFNNGTLEPFI